MQNGSFHCYINTDALMQQHLNRCLHVKYESQSNELQLSMNYSRVYISKNNIFPYLEEQRQIVRQQQVDRFQMDLESR